jgi:Na+/H+-dicarboxylate symporter
MFRTGTNVIGDVAAAAVVDGMLGERDPNRAGSSPRPEAEA